MNNQEACLIKLTFAKFMKEFCKKVLPPNWEQIVCMQMLSSQLNPSKCFDIWADEIMMLNVSLCNTSSHMSESQLRIQIDTALDEDLCAVITEEGLSSVAGFYDWMAKITMIDNCCQLECKWMADF